MINALTKRNELIIVAIIVLCALCYSMTGELLGSQIKATSNISSIQQSIKDTHSYPFSEKMDDELNYYYFQNGTPYYSELRKTVEELSKEPQFSFQGVGTQSLWIEKSTVVPDNAILETDSDNKQKSIRAVQLSQGAFSYANLAVHYGTSFSGNDYNSKLYDKVKTIPVLAGSSYKGTLSLNGTMDIEYLNKPFSLKIIGFLEEDSYYVGDTLVYLDNALVMPAPIPSEEQNSKFDKRRLLDLMNGTIMSEDVFENVYQKAEEVFQSNDLSMEKVISVSDGNDTSELNAFLSLTNEIKHQYALLVVGMFCFSLFAISLVVQGFVRDGYYELCVYKLCGTPWRRMMGSAMAVIVMPIVAGDFLASLWLLNNEAPWQAIIIIQGMTLMTVIVSAVAPIWQLRKLPFHEMLGGRE